MTKALAKIKGTKDSFDATEARCKSNGAINVNRGTADSMKAHAESSSRMIEKTLDVESMASLICPVEGCDYAKVQLYSTAVADVILQHHLATVHPAQARKGFSMFLKECDTPPGQEQDTLPGRERDTLPGEQHETLPGEEQVTLPGQEQATLPGQKQDTLPGQKETLCRDIKKTRACFNATEMLCSPKQTMSHEAVQEKHQVQKCTTVKDRVCKTTYDIDMTTKNVQRHCKDKETTVNNVICRYTFKIDPKKANSHSYTQDCTPV
jgi:hypothetical protein